MIERNPNKSLKMLSAVCEICGGDIESVIDLPSLPLTGIYSEISEPSCREEFNQALMFCSSCCHGQLKHSLAPEYLYGDTYEFRTSKSITATKGAQFFASYLERVFPKRKFNRVVEFGCNDVYLLELLSGKGNKFLGVDPIWQGREAAYQHDKIKIIGRMLQDVDILEELEGVPDLIISQHTMEHVEHPRELVKHLFEKVNSETIFLFEFPCFDPLIENLRFDQVFHQHLQYFSVKSFLVLLDQLGGELINYTINHSYWGALLIAFRKKKASEKQIDIIKNEQFPLTTVDSIIERYELFQMQLSATKRVLDKVDSNKLYGYGAALMLPILGYHLNTDFSCFRAILDDDIEKKGLEYPNLNVRIQHPENIDFTSLSICLTAMDNRRPILKRLLSCHPKQIINPLNIL